MAKRRIDANAILDAASAEATGEPLELELDGKVHVLPARMPGAVLIGFSRLAAGDPTGLTVALEALFGPDVLDELIARGVTFDELLALMQAVAEDYGVTLGELEASRAPSPSTSASSRPTSKPTTA